MELSRLVGVTDQRLPRPNVFQYRFTIQYRLRRRRSYLSLHEERLFHLDEHDRLTHYTLFRDCRPHAPILTEPTAPPSA